MLQRLLPSDLLRDAVEDLGQIITDLLKVWLHLNDRTI